MRIILPRNLLALFFFAAFCLRGICAVPFSWKLASFYGREYLSLEQIAEFYDLGSVVVPPENASARILQKGGRSLSFQINGRQVEINGVVHWLSFPTHFVDGVLWVSRMDLSKSVEPLLRPDKIQEQRTFDTVVIDPGHGGVDNGARGKWLPDEKTLALEMGERLKGVLQKSGFRVVMTRSRDIFVPLEDRAAIAAMLPKSILVSLHFNSTVSSVSGVETYALAPISAPSSSAEKVRATDNEVFCGNECDPNNVLLAHSIHARLTLTRENPKAESRGVRRARFVVLRECPRPSVLVEHGFVSNRNDALLMGNPEYRQKMAEAIALGIGDYMMQLKRGVPMADQFAQEGQVSARKAIPVTQPVVETAPETLPVIKREPAAKTSPFSVFSFHEKTNKAENPSAPFRPQAF